MVWILFKASDWDVEASSVIMPRALLPRRSAAPSPETCLYGGFEIQTTETLHLLMAAMRPSWCRRVSNLMPSLKAFKSFVLLPHEPPTRLAIIFSLSLRPTSSSSSFSMHSSSSMHHVDRPWNLDLTFTSHHRLLCRIYHLHFTSQDMHHTQWYYQSIIIFQGWTISPQHSSTPNQYSTFFTGWIALVCLGVCCEGRKVLVWLTNITRDVCLNWCQTNCIYHIRTHLFGFSI